MGQNAIYLPLLRSWRLGRLERKQKLEKRRKSAGVVLRQSRTVQCLLANSFKHLLGRMCAEVGVALQNCILGCAIHYGFYADGSLDCMLRSKIQRTKTCQKQVIFHVELHCLIRNNFHDFFLFCFFRSSRHHSGDYSEETGYVYRASATPDYPTAPPYNPEYPAHQNPYIAEQYPTGVIPPTAEYRQPLIQQQPPPYHDVITARR